MLLNVDVPNTLERAISSFYQDLCFLMEGKGFERIATK